jgi:putative ABC transport system permease protein
MLIELALRNLARTKVRSVLAVVGIIIGVMAISSIGIFGESLKAVVLKNFKDVADEILITPSYTYGYTSIDERTVEKIEKMPYAEKVIAVKSDSDLVVYKDKKTYATIYGMDIRDVKDLFELEKGSYKGCLVGSNIADFFDLRVGSKIKIKDRVFRVGGILKREARFDINPNFAVILPTRDYEKVFEGKEYSIVVIKVKDLNDVDDVKRWIDKNINRREDKVSVFEMRVIIEKIDQVFGKMTLFLMAIAGISLLVAGISILNIMLMSTIERTKEIGLMRAIGAYRHTILKIFLLEALILGLVGSVIGGALSFLGGYAIDMMILKTAEYVLQPISMLYVLLGMAFGIATALVSAFYPAWKASRLEPIKALRFE